MKVTDLRRKLMAALAAGGLLAPSAAYGADLNANLIVNSTFENVDANTLGGAYDTPRILDWQGPASFAYAHAGGGGIGPDYANGGPLTGGGAYYFSAGNSTPDSTAPGQIFQNIDVSQGPSGALIAGGTAAFRLSAFFSSYLTQGDRGHVHVNFLNAANTSLSTADIVDNDPTNWSEVFQGGLIPVGTATVRVSLYGVALVGGPDGYIDNVDFRVTNEVIQPVLSIAVNRTTGAITLNNQTGSAKNLASYSITSAFEALAPAHWQSIADNFDSGNPGPNQVDPTHPWTELTSASAHGDLSEGDLATGDGASLAHTRSLPIGNAGAWIRTPREDLVFDYVSNGAVVRGLVTYAGGSLATDGDLNFDGLISAADWTIVRTNQNADLSGMSLAEAYRLGDLTSDRRNDHADFARFKTLNDAANGVGAFAAMAANVPEPSSGLLFVGAGAFWSTLRRRNFHGSQTSRYHIS
jgi:hypothetical protein